MIRLREVSRFYASGQGRVLALEQVNVEIAEGEFVSITGPSGCGKSTLLHLLGGLDQPDAGEIWVGDLALHAAGDKALTRYRRFEIGFIFQFFNLLPSLTVEENVELPLLLRGESGAAVRERVASGLDLVGLLKRRSHYPHQLSGGEMQRVAIARALAGRPRLILADEPTGNLDSANAARVSETLLKISSQRIATMVIVTHSEELAKLASRRIRMLDGKIDPTQPL